MSYTPKSSKAAVLFTCITAALAGLLFGLDIGVVSGASAHFQKDFAIPDSMVEQIVSALLWGAVAGTFASGYFARKYGRRPTLIASALIFVVGSIACGFATTPWMLVAARFGLGIAVGAASFTAPLYLSEVAPQNIRGSLISMYQLMITIGILLAFLSDTWLSSYSSWTFGGEGNWRIMLGVVAIPAVFMLLGVIMLPESPRWLRLAGYNEKAKKVLGTLREAAEVQPELDAIDESLKVKQAGGSLFKTNANFRRVIFLGVTLQVIQQLTGINVIMYYAPRIFEIAGFESTLGQMWGTVAIGVTNVLATFIAIAFVDKLGRKPIMVAGLWVMGLSMVGVGSIFNHGVEGNQGLAYLSIACLIVFIIGFAMSAGPIVWILCSEIYPLSGRDFGVTVSTATNWIVNGIVGVTFLTLLNQVGPGNTFWLYGLMNIGFLVVFKFFVPETKGVSLERIEENLYAGKPLREIGNI
jgi:SP family galactose:H+ symporter-like MFS transporter